MTTYALQASTELFKSQKAAKLLSDQSSFAVLQNSVGQSLFFGIGDDHILYLSAEQDHVATGWTPIDLTTELASARQFQGLTVTAKSFAVGQSVTTGNILIVQILHMAETNTDALFALSGLSNAFDAAWMENATNRNWIARLYDDSAHKVTSLQIAYVEVPVSDDPLQAPCVMVGVQDPSSHFVQDYTVNLNALSAVWTLFATAENFETMNDMQIGKPEGALFPGLYQLYTLNNAPSVTFTPWQGGPVTKLTVPAGASSLAATPTGADGSTDLYLAATGGIWIYTADKQDNIISRGVQILIHPMIAGVIDLHAHVAGSQLSIWGLTNGGTVFYSRCALGSQSDPTAWSAPIPILQGVDQLATMLDIQTQYSVLFAYIVGQQMVKLTQDPVTTQWRRQSILLPHLAVTDTIEFYSYTTRVVIVDENNLPAPNNTFQVFSTSPVTVYIDDTYVTLSPTVPVQVTSDAQGSVTIVQETQTLGATCYHLVQGGTQLDVNPMTNAIQRMNNIQQGSDLAAVQVTDENNNTTSLVPSTVPAQNTDAVARGIAQFVKTSQTMPGDGTTQSASSTSRTMFDVSQDTVWGMKFSNGVISYYDGTQQASSLGLSYSAGGVAALKTDQLELGDVNDAIQAFAGDVFTWLETAVNQVEQFFIHVVDGVTSFFIQIGSALYRFVMRCINDVTQAIQFILNAIEVGFNKLVQWVGFIFSWQDIVITHKVLKNIFKTFALQCANNMSGYHVALAQAFDNIENAVNDWAGLPDVGGTAGSYSQTGQQPAGLSTPQAHHGIYQAKSNIGSATTEFTPSFGSGDQLQQLLQEFLDMIEREKTTLTGAYKSLKTEVIDQFTQLTATQIIKKLIAIIFDVILETVKNAALSVVDIIAILVTGAASCLDAQIDIPVLTPLYALISGGDALSFLDLVCLVVAIPVTIVGKLVTLSAPFPAGNFTDSVINAPDFATIQRLCKAQFAPAPAGGLHAVSKLAEFSPNTVAVWTLVGGVVGYLGSAFLSLFGLLKLETPSNVWIATAYAVSYLPYVAPDIMAQILAWTEPTWDVNMNTTITGIGVVKTFVDISLTQYIKPPNPPPGAPAPPEKGLLPFWNKASPWAEAFINVVWEIPVIAGFVRSQKASSIVGFIANTAFNASGWVAPGMADPDPEVQAATPMMILIFTGVYGQLSTVQGVLQYLGQ